MTWLWVLDGIKEYGKFWNGCVFQRFAYAYGYAVAFLTDWLVCKSIGYHNYSIHFCGAHTKQPYGQHTLSCSCSILINHWCESSIYGHAICRAFEQANIDSLSENWELKWRHWRHLVIIPHAGTLWHSYCILSSGQKEINVEHIILKYTLLQYFNT